MIKLAIFENFSISNEDSIDESLWPIKVKLNPSKVINILSQHLQKKGAEDLKVYSDNNEVYINEGDFQITYHLLIEHGGKTLIGASVYGENQRGKTRKKLRLVLIELKEIFDKYI